MSIVKEGWVEKCGPKIMPTWHRRYVSLCCCCCCEYDCIVCYFCLYCDDRWLVLYDSRVLEYFIDDSKRKLQGVIELTGREDLKIDGDPGKSFSKGFYLETDSRTYKFAVNNANQRSLWISALRDVISGNLKKKIDERRKRDQNALSPKHKKTASNGATVLTFDEFKNYSGDKSKTNNSGSTGTRGSVHQQNGNSPSNNSADKPQEKETNDDKKESSPPKLDMSGAVSEDDKSSITQLISGNERILETIVKFLMDVKKNEFSKLFQINKAFRNNLSVNHKFYDNYTIYIYPKHVLKRFSDKRSPTRPWIMAHDYKQIWVFGNVERV